MLARNRVMVLGSCISRANQTNSFCHRPALQFTCLDTANEAAQLVRGRVAHYVDWFPARAKFQDS